MKARTALGTRKIEYVKMLPGTWVSAGVWPIPTLSERGRIFEEIDRACERGDVEYLMSVPFIVGIKFARISRKAISSARRRAIIARDGSKCVACSSTDRLEVDHIIPVAFGGGDENENLQTLCLPCNRAKGPKPYAGSRRR